MNNGHEDLNISQSAKLHELINRTVSRASACYGSEAIRVHGLCYRYIRHRNKRSPQMYHLDLLIMDIQAYRLFWHLLARLCKGLVKAEANSTVADKHPHLISKMRTGGCRYYSHRLLNNAAAG